MQRNWRELIRPRSVVVDESSLTDRYGKFVAEPLERGFGTTIGNSLRRVLLSSIRGAAVTAVKIDGVLHEFSTIPEVVEDVSEICLNLKGVDLKMDGEEPRLVHARFEGERVVTAGDIFTGNDVVTTNPDHVVCNMGPGATLDIELTVKHGFGYVRAERNKDASAPVGTIPIDSIFTPIRRVNYRVSNARVGQMTDYDRLNLEVWTNGAVLPVDAVGIAAKIIKEQVKVFINFEEHEEDVGAAVVTGGDETGLGAEVGQTQEVLYRLVEELDLSVRAQNCLQNAGIKYVGELVQRTEQEMLKTRNFGRKSLKEIKDVLADLDLTLGMRLDGFDPEKRA
ncbi:MAG TPA: DNA-directed RNA polymerase subunit alpha [Myxococcota bacterium]|nr:DNA-directed RNA polymerase subunit alpha [Myxococcota bacterium]HOD08158.1 DNA-directed RNA polymerase subunit alpha [Myxococcota bacterium]HPB50297.1 DNA-directed RNA polymerase subunit alpha [Myxococcota bacterium]HQP95849.1 DNA-directed RNA polymerase subunit alpha [Myxococcota bacterium]